MKQEENYQENPDFMKKLIITIAAVLLIIGLISGGWIYWQRQSVQTARNTANEAIGSVKYLDCYMYFNSKGEVIDSVVCQKADAQKEEVESVPANSASNETGETSGTISETTDGTEPEVAESSEVGESSAPEEATMQETQGEDSKNTDSSNAQAAENTDTFNVEDAAKEQADSDQTAEESGEDALEESTISINQIPYIEGLDFDYVVLNQKLPVENEKIFNTIAALNKMIQRYEIVPDRIVIEQNKNINLYYADVQILLGEDKLLEEKMTRVSAILPKLTGQNGVLHLEDFEKNTTEIIFEKNE